ncbi:MAG: autotransporter-associated beta strand repeat-containing protein, partial [Rhizomicrobium sp.]
FLTGPTDSSTTATLSGIISGIGGLTKSGLGTLTLSGANDYNGDTTVSAGTLKLGASNVIPDGTGNGNVSVAGTLDLNGYDETINGLSGAGTVDNTAASTTSTLMVGNNDATSTFSGVIQNTGGTLALTKTGSGILTLSGANTYTGATNVNAGTFQAGAANTFASGSAFTVSSPATLDLNDFNQSIDSLAGDGDITLGSATLTTGGTGTSATFSGAISGTGGLTKTGSGTFTLSGTSLYNGATSVDAGTLSVNGSIADSTVTVKSGATLGGTGTVGPTTIESGGTLAPGNSIGTITVGTLTLNSGSFYNVEVSPTDADKTVVTGTASLAGTVQATFGSGTYTPQHYTIVTSTDLLGTTFDTLTTSGALPSGFTASLSYTTTDAMLDLTATLGKGQNLDGNQQSVANSINDYFNGGGTLPANFYDIYSLSGADLRTALTRLSGEPATGAQQGAFQLMDEFLGLMLDPFADPRRAHGFGGALGYAQEQPAALPPEAALAYASATHGRYRSDSSFDRPWGIWTTGFGGSGPIHGDAATGSHDTNVGTYGIAMGLDYRFSPDTVAGVAVSGGGTEWSLASNLGGGSSDVFQIG